MESGNGVEWYAMKPYAEAPAFEADENAYGYNQAQFREFMPGFEQPITTVDGSGVPDGYFDVRHSDCSGTRFYDATQYDTPRGNFQNYEDHSGNHWYAIHGEAAIERKPVYEDGKPVYDGDNIRSISVDTVRYRNTPTHFPAPSARSDDSMKPPRRKQ